MNEMAEDTVDDEVVSQELEQARNIVEIATNLVNSKQRSLIERIQRLHDLQTEIQQMQNELEEAETQRDAAVRVLEAIENNANGGEGSTTRMQGGNTKVKKIRGTLQTECKQDSKISNYGSAGEDTNEELQEIIAKLPEELKSNFGQIMFCQWKNVFRPVLVLDPFRVPPGLVQDMWYDIYDEQVNGGNRLCDMTNLIYWYGGADDPTLVFTMVPSSDLIPYDEGAKKGYNKLSNQCTKEIDDRIIKGFEEMEADLKKKPEERFGPDGLSFLEFRKDEGVTMPDFGSSLTSTTIVTTNGKMDTDDDEKSSENYIVYVNGSSPSSRKRPVDITHDIRDVKSMQKMKDETIQQ